MRLPALFMLKAVLLGDYFDPLVFLLLHTWVCLSKVRTAAAGWNIALSILGKTLYTFLGKITAHFALLPHYSLMVSVLFFCRSWLRKSRVLVRCQGFTFLQKDQAVTRWSGCLVQTPTTIYDHLWPLECLVNRTFVASAATTTTTSKMLLTTTGSSVVSSLSLDHNESRSSGPSFTWLGVTWWPLHYAPTWAHIAIGPPNLHLSLEEESENAVVQKMGLLWSSKNDLTTTSNLQPWWSEIAERSTQSLFGQNWPFPVSKRPPKNWRGTRPLSYVNSEQTTTFLVFLLARKMT